MTSKQPRSTPPSYPLYVISLRNCDDNGRLNRYEIEVDAPAWEEAEKQVLDATKSGKTSTVVSVKTKTKRKAGPTAAEVYEEAFGEKSRKKAKKSGKKA